MSDPLIYSCDEFVVLEPGNPEKILTAQETLEWLKIWLKDLEKLPKDLHALASIDLAAERLLDTACELEIKPGFKLQWFAVRTDPPVT